MITTIHSKSDKMKSEYNLKFKHSSIISTLYAMKLAKTYLISNVKWLKPMMILIIVYQQYFQNVRLRMFQEMFSKVVSWF